MTIDAATVAAQLRSRQPRLLIDGQWVEPRSGKTLESISPRPKNRSPPLPRRMNRTSIGL